MHVTVLLFAQARERAGAERIALALPDGSHLAEALAEIRRAHPALEPLWPHLAVAVDGRLAAGYAPLADGAELALLPPVSGGRPDLASLVRASIALEPLLAAAARPDCGAVAFFVGTTRDHHEGRRVARLAYEGYEPMALAALAAIERAAPERFDVARCAIVHRLGEVPLTEASVVVVVSAAHRAPAFDACRWAMDELKRTVPIWKKEHFAEGGEAWVEGTRLKS
jgi:molybdopterin synthase catalytic subunit/molybdopterin converting factor small subunit